LFLQITGFDAGVNSSVFRVSGSIDGCLQRQGHADMVARCIVAGDSVDRSHIFRCVETENI
jgi:hypothetical protein